MADIPIDAALPLVKARLNRLPSDASLDGYLRARIRAAAGELKENGITLTESDADLLLLVDFAVWRYENRDTAGGMPEWLRLRRRERWLKT